METAKYFRSHGKNPSTVVRGMWGFLNSTDNNSEIQFASGTLREAGRLVADFYGCKIKDLEVQP
jgi:hypothetical protein